MSTALKGIYKVNEYRYNSKDGEMAFVYNILMPDLFLFTISASIGFYLLMNLFGSTN